MGELDAKQTNSFMIAVQLGTVRAAAERIGVEPSTISRNIIALETTLATTLIERGRSGVRPTQAGALLVAYLNRQEGELELLRSEFDALANLKRGNVSLAVGEGFVGDLFDKAISQFADKYPSITFSIDVGSTEAVKQLLTTEQAHIGFAYNIDCDPQIRVEFACKQPLVALFRRGGEFDPDGPADMKHLSQLPCAIPPKDFGIGTLIAAYEAKYGQRFRAHCETGSIAALKGFVRNDMGFTILPKFVVDHELSTGIMCSYPISSKMFEQGVCSLVRKEGRQLPRAAHLFLNFAKAMSAFE
jgi:DNA-binding transcriptional LysR family regulator